ncbi:MAG: HEAT repeat domain-containing protein, partial [Natronomonas sp.]
RAAAAWSLVQIGTKDALEAAAEHADDRAYTVQVEAERAEELLAAAAEEPTA